MQRRRIEVRSQRRARLRALRLGHLWARSYWFGCRWGKPEGRLSSLPNEMRTKLGLLDVGSTWLPFPEVAANILTDLLLERNGSRKLDFRFTEFYEVQQYSEPERRERSFAAPDFLRLTLRRVFLSAFGHIALLGMEHR